MNYDVAIIGAGPGGYVASIRAAQLGLAAALIEKDELGGTCLNRGCIPTKSFVAVAERLHDAARLKEFGIEGNSACRVNIESAVARKNKIVESLRGGIQTLLKARKVEIFKGAAKIVSQNEIDVDGKRLTAKNIIIATGSAWQALPNLTPDGKFIVTSDHMLDLKSLPKRLVVVGGGVVGCEFASFMNIFGVDVTIVELMGQILPLEDALLAKSLAAIFKKRGIKIFNNVMVDSVSSGEVKLSSGEKLSADLVLVSVGRKPCADDFKGSGIEMNKGFILTDEYMRTSIPNIYAIGDVAVPRALRQAQGTASGSKAALAHVASREGIVAVENIKMPGSKKMNYDVVPRPVFTTPEIACVGRTEAVLKAEGTVYKTGRFPFAALGKAVCDGSTDGFMQVYSANDGKILGACCMGAHASDIIAEAALAMRNGLKVDSVIDTIHSHPTYSEAVAESFEDAIGMAIHKMSK